MISGRFEWSLNRIKWAGQNQQFTLSYRNRELTTVRAFNQLMDQMRPMDKREDLLKDTFEIRERLPELLGDVWRKTDRDLGHLLARHLAGEDVEGDIIDLLLRHKPIKEWIEGQAGSRTFHYLTGKYDPLLGARPPPRRASVSSYALRAVAPMRGSQHSRASRFRSVP